MTYPQPTIGNFFLKFLLHSKFESEQCQCVIGSVERRVYLRCFLVACTRFRFTTGFLGQTLKNKNKILGSGFWRSWKYLRHGSHSVIQRKAVNLNRFYNLISEIWTQQVHAVKKLCVHWLISTNMLCATKICYFYCYKNLNILSRIFAFMIDSILCWKLRMGTFIILIIVSLLWFIDTINFVIVWLM